MQVRNMELKMNTAKAAFKAAFKAVTDRIRVFLFGIAISIMGLFSPSFALRVTHAVLNDVM